MLLPVGLALLGVAWFLRAATTNRGAICYAAGMLSAIYVHNVSAFLAAACAITVALDLITNRHVSNAERHKTLVRWIVVNSIVALFSIPELLAMLAELRTEQLFWMAPTSLWDIRSSVATFVAGPATSPLAVATAMALLLAAALLMALVRSRIDRRATMVLIAIPALDFAFILAAGLRQALLFLACCAGCGSARGGPGFLPPEAGQHALGFGFCPRSRLHRWAWLPIAAGRDREGALGITSPAHSAAFGTSGSDRDRAMDPAYGAGLSRGRSGRMCVTGMRVFPSR